MGRAGTAMRMGMRIRAEESEDNKARPVAGVVVGQRFDSAALPNVYVRLMVGSLVTV